MTAPPEFDFVTSDLLPGLSVIEASAGTGKTYAISHLVPRLLLEGTVANLSEVLLVTFTNDAARELSDRVRRVLEELHGEPAADESLRSPGVARLREKFGSDKHRRIIARALLDIDRLNVSTIHSFCQRTLQMEGALCGLPVIPELIPTADQIIEQVLYELWKQRLASNEWASAIASNQKWAVSEDLSLVKTALARPDADLIPHPKSFEATLAEFEEFPRRFDLKVCAELEDFFRRVSAWNKGAPDERERDLLVNSLREVVDIDKLEFLDIAARLTALPSWVTARSNLGKALRAEAETLKAVLIARELDQSLSSARWHWQGSCIEEIQSRVRPTLHENRQITYDGLIETLSVALKGVLGPALAARLRSLYQVALIDESQDTDARQFEIFQKIFLGNRPGQVLETHRLVLIGDPKQAIYAFRGADVNTYLDAKAAAGAQVFRLNQTFRSPEPLVQATNAFFSRPDSLLKSGLSFADAVSGIAGDIQLQVGGEADLARIEAWMVPDEAAEEYSNKQSRLSLIAAAVATEIVRLLNERAEIVRIHSEGAPENRKLVKPGNFAVLVSDRYQADAVVDALRARRVPAIASGAGDVLDSEEAAELLILLRALQQPRRSGLRFAALATQLLGRNDAAIRAIQESAELDDAMLEKFLEWQVTLRREGISSALAQIDREQGITLRLASLTRGERRVTNLRQLLDLLQAAALELGNHSGNLVRWFAQEIAKGSERKETDERLLQLESDADAVQVVTMHSCKGLEYDLVFCPFLWSSRKTDGVAQLAVRGEKLKIVNLGLAADPVVAAAIDRDTLEDRLRLAYVAITRAKTRLWIYGGAVSGSNPPSALDWLLRAETPASFEPWFAEAAKPGKGGRQAEGLAAIGGRKDGNALILQREPPIPSDVAWNTAEADSILAITPQASPRIPAAWVMTSFSSLTREKNSRSGPDVVLEEGPEESAPPNAFFSAPSGAMIGTAIHEWIENWDFSPPDESAVKSHLANYPLPATSEENPQFVLESVMGGLNELRGAVLPGLDCSIAQACNRPEASEWHFQLPIEHSLSPSLLAQCFSAHGEAEYARILEALPAEELQGFLHGFLDRIACWNGVWGVIDWKTNRLGKTLGAYRPNSLHHLAIQSHYLLQAHLYLIALRRFLGPDVKIAGAWLVFLRGVRAGTAEGILHIQPPDSRMAALDSLFAQPTFASAQ